MDYALAREYHRGYEDGRAARLADEWKLDQDRKEITNNLKKIYFEPAPRFNNSDQAYVKTAFFNLQQLYTAIVQKPTGYRTDLTKEIADKLIQLLVIEK